MRTLGTKLTFVLLAMTVASTAHSQPQDASTTSTAKSAAERAAAHYVEQARERYEDSVAGARHLLQAVLRFLREPSEESHAAAKQAWLKAHSIYSHTEVFRFGNPNVDAWEGKVNAWPMDEGLIDYVANGYVYHEGNEHGLANIIATGTVPIDEELIAEYQSGADPKAAAKATGISDIETNVTRGYHAIEFLLWGQDLNETPTASGQRPFTDFVVGDAGTNGHNARRREYLKSAVGLLIRDLRYMVWDWDPARRLYAKRFAELPVEERLDRMIVGMGTLCFGEIASERMQVALISSDQEEEQDCFSDTTHHSIYHSIRSIETLYLGRHERMDGTVVEGPSLSHLVRIIAPGLDAELRTQFETTQSRAREVLEAGNGGEPFDRMILADNDSGRARIKALMEQLRIQTELLESIRGAVAKTLASNGGDR